MSSLRRLWCDRRLSILADPVLNVRGHILLLPYYYYYYLLLRHTAARHSYTTRHSYTKIKKHKTIYLPLPPFRSPSSISFSLLPSLRRCLSITANETPHMWNVRSIRFHLATLCCRRVSVRLSVTWRRSTQTAKHIGSCKQRHTIAHGDSSFLMPKISAKFQQGHTNAK